MELTALWNTFYISQSGSPAAAVQVRNDGLTSATVNFSNNIVAGNGRLFLTLGASGTPNYNISGVNNWFTTGSNVNPLTGTIFGSTPGFTNAAIQDFTLTSNSSVLGKASTSVIPKPISSYKQPSLFVERVSANDLGAFEYNVFAQTATISWDSNTEPDIAGYKIYYGTSPRTGIDPKVCGLCGYSNSVNVGNVLTYAFDSLTNGPIYYFSVAAYDTSNNESIFSSEVNKIISTIIDTQTPSIPTNFSATSISSSQINLAWNASTDNVGVTGYKVYRNGNQIALTSSLSFSDTGLVASTLYSYTVSSYDASNNNSSQTSVVSATTFGGGGSGGGGGGSGSGGSGGTGSTPGSGSNSSTPGTSSSKTPSSSNNQPSQTPTPSSSSSKPYPNGTLLKASGDSKVYLIQNSLRSWIPSIEVFSVNGYSWKNVKEVDSSVVSKYQEGKAVSLTIPTLHQKASLVKKTKDTKVYAIVNGKRHWIFTPTLFNLYQYQWSKVKIISEKSLNQYPIVKLIRAYGDPKVYYLTSQGKKKWISNLKVFNSYKNKWSDVIEVLPTELNSYPDVNLIKSPKDGKIYLLEGITKHWIKSPKTFQEKGYKWEDVDKTINQTEFEAYQEGEEIE